jgi:hypothetical protein
MASDPTKANGLHSVPAQAQDATEVALIGLISEFTQANTAAIKEMSGDVKAGMEAMAKEMRTLFRMLGVAFLLMVAGIVALGGAGLYLKTAGVEIHTSAAP